MREKPKQPTRLILVGVIGIVVLAAIGFGIAFAINKARDITPTVTESTEQCCSCHWYVETEDGRIDLGTLGGLIDVGENQCKISSDQPDLGNDSPTSCADIPITEIFDAEALPSGVSEDDTAIAEEFRPACSSGTLSHTSSPVLPPDSITQENSEATLNVVYEYYTPDENADISEIEMSYEYPNEADAPSAETAEPEFIRNRVDTDSLVVKVYRATFSTQWRQIFDLDVPGNYSVKFRAKNQNDEWIPENQAVPTTYIHEFLLTEEMAGTILTGSDSYCYNLDVRPSNGVGPLDVTLTADIAFPENVTSSQYRWELDLDCSGTADANADEENPEIFTTDSDTESVTRTFTYPASGEGTVLCPVRVYGEVTDASGTSDLEEVTEGACTDVSVSLNPAPETCGNGLCDESETCDTDGNLECPDGTPLSQGYTCRQDCLYCGDGLRNGSEECDVNAAEGTSGYNVDCLDDCTIEKTGDDDTDDSGTSGTGDASTLVITQQTPQCLELVAPNNTGTVVVSVKNNDTSAIAIRAISDALPQGVLYSTGSSLVNSVSNPSDTGVTVETSGDSQLITWDNDGSGWTIAAGGTLALSFSVTAGSDALIGNQTNEVTVTPSDDNPIPSESNLLLAQVCTQPLTGIFDQTIVVLLIGLLFLVIAGAAYYTGIGTNQAALFIDKATDQVKTLGLRLTKPQKYMEQQIESSALKKIRDRTNAKQKQNKRGRKK